MKQLLVILFGSLFALFAACGKSTVSFVDSHKTALELAGAKNKPVLVDFYSPT
ncbi:MAG: hypothetical protein U5R06_05740 [candidate division KSB1 bacterium]|nr:hypothetical protein [candidate division KSB1 bacterium]